MDEHAPTGNDHDLLVELRTEMRGMRTDVREMKNGNERRLLKLEESKADKEEVARLVAEAEKEHEKLWGAVGGLGKRTGRNEVLMGTLLGGLVVVEILLRFADLGQLFK